MELNHPSSLSGYDTEWHTDIKELILSYYDIKTIFYIEKWLFLRFYSRQKSAKKPTPKAILCRLGPVACWPLIGEQKEPNLRSPIWIIWTRNLSINLRSPDCRRSNAPTIPPISIEVGAEWPSPPAKRKQARKWRTSRLSPKNPNIAFGPNCQGQPKSELQFPSNHRMKANAR